MQLIGRSSSHFTRVARIFAHELSVPCELAPVHAITSDDPSVYGGNPTLKIPALRVADTVVFGAENICRRLARGSRARVVWPEEVEDDVARNAQELVWHAMAAQVQLVFGIAVAGLPAENVYFAKARAGLAGALRWLDDHLGRVLDALPAPRDLSLLEVTLFCLLEHLTFRETLPAGPFPALARFAADFAQRPSARQTEYRFDPPPKEKE